ncbi:MAG TPA: DHH family phosphoesterase [Candidatus Paceibacterota bacterium]
MYKESKQILEEIKKANKILLHCHPMPDPDSVGSVLAMKFVLESMNKKVTVIKGDSNIPEAFIHFPGARDIVNKNFYEIEQDDFDLFIILDSGSSQMISKIKTPVFPLLIKTIVIDHHITNEKYADINLIDTTSPATCQILFNLFKDWEIEITKEIATNLFIGLYTDTGAFKYPPSDYHTLEIASELAKIAPDYEKTIFIMENSLTKEAIYFQAIALSSVKTFLNDNIAIAIVSNEDLIKNKIPEEYIRGISISNILKSVIGWNIGISMIEIESNIVKISCRTRDIEKYDVSKLASALGGGGHKGAAGVVLNMPLEEAVSKVVDTVKVVYNL